VVNSAGFRALPRYDEKGLKIFGINEEIAQNNLNPALVVKKYCNQINN
jgi:hypothetical protein